MFLPIRVRRQAGFTLVELLITLGILALIGGALYAMFGGSSPAVPGADQYAQNLMNAENMIGQLGATNPVDPDACANLQRYYNAADQGYNTMQTSGVVDSNTLRVARGRLDKIQQFIKERCG